MVRSHDSLMSHFTFYGDSNTNIVLTSNKYSEYGQMFYLYLIQSRHFLNLCQIILPYNPHIDRTITIYGVFKQINEGNKQSFHNTENITTSLL